MNTKIAQLKSEAYDLIAQIEAHQIHVVKLQKMLQEKNEEIKGALTEIPQEELAEELG